MYFSIAFRTVAAMDLWGMNPMKLCQASELNVRRCALLVSGASQHRAGPADVHPSKLVLDALAKLLNLHDEFFVLGLA